MAKFRGGLDYRGADHVLIDVRGVGYIVYVSDRTMAALPRVGEAVALLYRTSGARGSAAAVRLSDHAGKGMAQAADDGAGRGGQGGDGDFGRFGAEGVARAITLGDARAIQAAPGVGPKMAQRVVLELKSKAPSVMAMGAKLRSARPRLR